MPAIASGKNQAEMREIIRRERKVELAMEGLRLQDIRRWGIAEAVMDGPLYGRPNEDFGYSDLGIPVFDDNGNPNYGLVDYTDKLRIVEVRSFNPDRDYLWPIPQADIDTNDQLDQNSNY